MNPHNPFDQDPFFKQFEEHRKQVGRMALWGGLWSLLLIAAIVGGFVWAVLYIHRHW